MFADSSGGSFPALFFLTVDNGCIHNEISFNQEEKWEKKAAILLIPSLEHGEKPFVQQAFVIL